MKKSGVTPDAITYNTFVASYAADAMFVEAVDVVQYMIKQGCRPNESTYNAIVDWYCKLNRRGEAIKFIANVRQLDPHIRKGEESRLSDRIAKVDQLRERKSF
ncbi:hypothetical protein AgCh_017069 [Apium graveolens]